MKKIDCCGDMCPIPLLKLKKEVLKLKSLESVVLVTDHSCVVESIRDYYKNSSFSFNFKEVFNGVWEITVTKN